MFNKCFKQRLETREFTIRKKITRAFLRKIFAASELKIETKRETFVSQSLSEGGVGAGCCWGLRGGANGTQKARTEMPNLLIRASSERERGDKEREANIKNDAHFI